METAKPMFESGVGLLKAEGHGAAAAEYTRAIFWTLVAGVGFFAAYHWPYGGWLSLVYLFALLKLTQSQKWRLAFYPGIAVGMITAVTRLDFFWNIFSAGAMALWLVYAIWIGIFVGLARVCLKTLPSSWALLTIPFLWTGLEYFRSELYLLKFSWLSPGYAFAGWPSAVPLHWLGAYGIGFVLMSIVSLAVWMWRSSRLSSALILVFSPGVVCLAGWWTQVAVPPATPNRHVLVAGMQMEFPTESQVMVGLRELVRRYPQAELLVVSEYTLDGPVPASLIEWCRKSGKYLVIGGKDPAGKGQFYNTAFVLSPEGRIVFKQVKSVPIQFFKDGLPAPEQNVWDSPWGKLGICICYDLSYRRVTDRLVRQGAEALIVPTMDVADWGARQHALHARVTPIRAAEYGIPIFRVASSGISQAVDCRGRLTASAPFPGDGVVLTMNLPLGGPGRLPLDTWLAPVAVGISACAAALFVWLFLREKRQSPKESDAQIPQKANGPD